MWYKWQIITKMNDSCIWHKITYVSIWKCEEWIIKSYDNKLMIAWVVFKCNNDWKNYKDYTAELCKFIDLEF